MPRLAVGRLVETPAEINGRCSRPIADDADGDARHRHRPRRRLRLPGRRCAAPSPTASTTGGRTVDGTLIDVPGATPTRGRAPTCSPKLFPTGGASPLIASINAHYDHTALLPSPRATPAAAASSSRPPRCSPAAPPTGSLNRLLFTMGCHAGLAVPGRLRARGRRRRSTPCASTGRRRSRQAKVAVYVANTGFGIGDTSSVAYSERLMGLYAKLLDGSLTVGQALAYAKQAYYGSLGAVGVYDFKILQQTAFYGLPFWKVSTGTASRPRRSAPTCPASIVLRMSRPGSRR